MEEAADTPHHETNGHGEYAETSEDEGCGSITKVSVRKRSSGHSVTFNVVDHVVTTDERNLETSDADDECEGTDHLPEEKQTSQVAAELSVTTGVTNHQVPNRTEEAPTSDRRHSATSVVSRHSQTSDTDVVDDDNAASNCDKPSAEITRQPETVETNGTASSESGDQPLKSNGIRQRQVSMNGVKPPDVSKRPVTTLPSSKQSIISQGSKRSVASSGSKRSVTFDTSRNDVMPPQTTLHNRLRAAGRARGLDDATLRRIARKLPVVSDTLPPQSCHTLAALPSRPALSNHKKVAGRLFSKNAVDAEQWTRYTDRNISPPLPGGGAPRRRSRGSLSLVKAPLELVPDKDLGPRLHAFEPRPQSYHHPLRSRLRTRPLGMSSSPMTHARTDVYSISFRQSDGGSVSGSDNGCDPDSELRSDYYSVKRVTLRSRATTCPADRTRPAMVLLGRQKCLHDRDVFGDEPSSGEMVSEVVGVHGVHAAKL